MPAAPPRRIPAGWAVALGASLGLAAMLHWLDGSPYAHGQALLPPRPLPAAKLQDGQARAVDLQGFQGRWLLVYFGFTYCPDVCPAALTNLADVLQALEENRDRLQAVFVSIDPARDTPQGVERFVRYFHPRILGLTGSEAEVGTLIRAAGTPFPFARDPARNAPDPSLHPADIFVVDPKGRLVAKYADDTPAADLVRDLRPLLSD